MIGTEELITALIVVDVAATLAGNYILWQIVMKQDHRLTRIEAQHENNHRRIVPE